MSNEANRRMTTIYHVLKSRPFGRGFAAYRAGEPFEPEAYQDLNAQWNYERGRILAACYDGALRINRRVSKGAIIAARETMRTRGLI